jgi:hypothetical protein
MEVPLEPVSHAVKADEPKPEAPSEPVPVSVNLSAVVNLAAAVEVAWKHGAYLGKSLQEQAIILQSLTELQPVVEAIRANAQMAPKP